MSERYRSHRRHTSAQAQAAASEGPEHHGVLLMSITQEIHPAAAIFPMLDEAERVADQDKYALSALRRELIRRLDLARERETGLPGKEAKPCR